MSTCKGCGAAGVDINLKGLCDICNHKVLSLTPRERVLLARERNGDPFGGSWRIVPTGVIPDRDSNYEYAFFERVP